MMLIVSMLLFSRLIAQRLSDLQISSVLHLIGDKGRKVMREMFRHLDEQGGRQRANAEERLSIVRNSARLLRR